MYMKAVKTNGHSGYSIPGAKTSIPSNMANIACPTILAKKIEGRDIIRDSGKLKEDMSNRTMLGTKYYFVQER